MKPGAQEMGRELGPRPNVAWPCRHPVPPPRSPTAQRALRKDRSAALPLPKSQHSPRPRGLQALALSCSLTFTPSPLNRLRPSGAGLARLIPTSGPLHSNASCLECPVPRQPHGWLLLIFRHLFKCDPLREPSLTTPGQSPYRVPSPCFFPSGLAISDHFTGILSTNTMQMDTSSTSAHP